MLSSVSEAEADTICAAYERGGEVAAATTRRVGRLLPRHPLAAHRPV